MDIMKAAALFAEYRARKVMIDKTLHPDDEMFRSAANGMAEYLAIGESTIVSLLKAAQIAELTRFGDILDFGCGHGREGRHLKIAFPEARLHFSDIDPTCWAFCAEQFGGEGFPSVEDFSTLSIPRTYDLIWLGSVFTHLDWERSRTLLRKLTDALNPGGAVVASFRGRACLERMETDMGRFNQGGYYDKMFKDYQETGFGYMDYKGFTNWGQNLIDFGKLEDLTPDDPKVHCVATLYKGWAGIHDIGVWMKSA